jgi:hypothetical protein
MKLAFIEQIAGSHPSRRLAVEGSHPPYSWQEVVQAAFQQWRVRACQADVGSHSCRPFGGKEFAPPGRICRESSKPLDGGGNFGFVELVWGVIQAAHRQWRVCTHRAVGRLLSELPVGIGKFAPAKSM